MQIKKRYIIFFSIGILIIFSISLATFYILFPASSVFAVETSKNNSKDVIISISPEKELFRVANMAPGIMEGAPLTVINKGSNDFSYNISAEMESGDLLYNELNLTIKDKKGNMLYSEKLRDLKNFELGNLKSCKDETFNISVGLPCEAGNEYQGTRTSVKFVLTAHPS